MVSIIKREKVVQTCTCAKCAINAFCANVQGGGGWFRRSNSSYVVLVIVAVIFNKGGVVVVINNIRKNFRFGLKQILLTLIDIILAFLAPTNNTTHSTTNTLPYYYLLVTNTLPTLVHFCIYCILCTFERLHTLHF